MTDFRALWIVLIVSLVTVLLRFLPFIIFRNRETPKFITYLGTVVPYAIMGMLVIYCLKNITFTESPYAIPEILACAVVALIHIWRRNTLLSIITGTVTYMVLIQFVF